MIVFASGCTTGNSGNFAGIIKESVKEHELASGGCVHIPPVGDFSYSINGEIMHIVAEAEDKDYGTGCNNGDIEYFWKIERGDLVDTFRGNDIFIDVGGITSVVISLTIRDDDGQAIEIIKELQKETI